MYWTNRVALAIAMALASAWINGCASSNNSAEFDRIMDTHRLSQIVTTQTELDGDVLSRSVTFGDLMEEDECLAELFGMDIEGELIRLTAGLGPRQLVPFRNLNPADNGFVFEIDVSTFEDGSGEPILQYHLIMILDCIRDVME